MDWRFFMGGVMAHIVVYTRDGCHLCDEAVALVSRYAQVSRLIDIDQDPDLQARFTTCVPVVEIDGRIRFRGRVNELLLRRILEAES